MRPHGTSHHVLMLPLQLQTTILITFAVESRQEWATQVGPFYFRDMFAALGFGGATGVMIAIIGGRALLPIIAVQFVSTRADKC
ncbi:Major facilitator superfamily domain general substrate transporter [Penicillium fimorum]|uniref:Major facilitator superfamily domain general substrate transporter n=1 Tax=Penicillium fimorum TaxID=1882269 RepID=A0A9X0C0V8_9EURO|nr:Major facilitator superfamily domain general substrate transporter [Penicillium fimorum]